MKYFLFRIFLAADPVTIDPNTGKVSGGGFFNGSVGQIFGKVTDFLIFLVGAVSILMVVWGGLLERLQPYRPHRRRRFL